MISGPARSSVPAGSGVKSDRAPFSRRFLTRLARGQPMGVGAYMYVAHRLAGLVLTIYLFVHLYTLGSAISGAEDFNQAMAKFDNTFIRLLELGLVGVVLFHTFNGIRLLILHFVPTVSQKKLAYTVVALTLGITVASVPLFVRG